MRGASRSRVQDTGRVSECGSSATGPTPVDNVLQACRGQVSRLQEYGTCGPLLPVDAMSESSPDLGLRPVAAQGLEAPTRRPSAASGTSRENRAVLFPETDPEDEPQPEKRGRFQRMAKPVAYVASALAGAVLVTAIYGLIGPRPG